MLLTHLAFNGDILIPAPGWVSYEPQAEVGSNKVHWIETSKSNNWYPTAKELESKIRKVGKKKNLILILNSLIRVRLLMEHFKQIHTLKVQLRHH